jgi:hypothetical protein
MARGSRTIPIYVLSFFVLFAPALGSAAESDPDLPAIDPPGRGRIMGHDDATSTSTCVGNPITPLCAVESIIACFVRNRDDLCQIGMGLDRPPGMVRGEFTPYSYQRYRVLSAKKFGEKDLPPPRQLSLSAALSPPWWHRPQNLENRPGDVQIIVLEQTCWRNSDRCSPVFTSDRFTYYVRQTGHFGIRWVVIDWTTPDPRYEKYEDKREKF